MTRKWSKHSRRHVRAYACISPASTACCCVFSRVTHFDFNIPLFLLVTKSLLYHGFFVDICRNALEAGSDFLSYMPTVINFVAICLQFIQSPHSHICLSWTFLWNRVCRKEVEWCVSLTVCSCRDQCVLITSTSDLLESKHLSFVFCKSCRKWVGISQPRIPQVCECVRCLYGFNRTRVLFHFLQCEHHFAFCLLYVPLRCVCM